MPPPTRRAFLGATLAGLATGSLFAAPKSADPGPDAHDSSSLGTLFLTWQRDPTTTMTVQWVGPAAETPDPTVSYAQADATAWQSRTAALRPYGGTDLKVFRAELTGLSPDTDYQFRVGKQTAVYRFRTMPAKATDTISFISGGDSGVNPHAVANNVQAARQDPMFVVVGGDLAYDDGRSVETSLAFIRNYSKHVVAKDGRLIPLLAAIGNHEVQGGYGTAREKAPFFYALFDGLFTDTGYAALDFGDYLSLVLLDTGHTSAIGGDQADWLEKTLKARADHPHVIAVNHVPAYPSFRSAEAGTGEGNRKYWVPLFEKYRVPAVLEHHDHTFKRTKPLLGGLADDNGVLYLGDGSWGQLRKPNSPDKLSYLAVSSQAYHLSLHRIQGQERYHLALDEDGKVMDVCRSGQRKTGSVRAGG
jgi:acid phosphatase type 7